MSKNIVELLFYDNKKFKIKLKDTKMVLYSSTLRVNMSMLNKIYSTRCISVILINRECLELN